MKLCSRTKCWQVTLRFDCHSNFHFFSRKNLFYFQICNTEWPCHFYFKVPRSCLFLYLYMLQVVTLIFFFISVLVMIFLVSYLTSLQTFFSYPTTFANNLFVFSDRLQTIFFNISHSPLQKNNGPSLTWRKAQATWLSCFCSATRTTMVKDFKRWAKT